MPTLNAGSRTNVSIQQGKILRLKADANGSGQVWNANGVQQDTLNKTVVPGATYHFGPYGALTTIRLECNAGSFDYQMDFLGGFEVARQMGTLVKSVTGATYTLSDADHGYMLLFAAACTVTVPKGVRSDFSCGWSQESTGAITFAAGSGATLNSKGGVLASSAQYSVGGLSAFAPDVFRLMGV
jgi:hypothetical protein